MFRSSIAASAWVVIAGLTACGGKAVIDPIGSGGGDATSSNNSSNNSTSTGMSQTCDTQFQSAQSDADWDDVFALLSSPDEGNCGTAGCHSGANPPADFFFDELDDARSYINMVTFDDTSGAPFVNPDQPLASWIHCFIRGDGSPLHGLSPQAHLVLEDWIFNGVVGP